jgi:hypothetical protein
MTLSLAVEFVLSGLLATTLVYCVLLERRLSALRKGQDGLKDTFIELNGAIISAGASMRALRETASNTAESLDERISRARAMSDELSLLTASGERIASRIETGAPQRNGAMLSDFSKPAVLASRLEALRPEALRNVR